MILNRQEQKSVQLTKQTQCTKLSAHHQHHLLSCGWHELNSQHLGFFVACYLLTIRNKWEALGGMAHLQSTGCHGKCLSYPAPVVVLKLLTLPFSANCCFPLKWVCYSKSKITEVTYRVGGRQQAPLDESFKRSFQNKVLFRDGLLGDLLCWQSLHVLSNKEQVRLFQVTVVWPHVVFS